MAFADVCRLCLTTDDLVWIFDEENTKLKMKDIVSITTGIEFHRKDIISQKICENCYQFSIKIFQFRGQCLKADKYLKSLCMDYLVDEKHYIPNTAVAIKGIVKDEMKIKEPSPIITKRPAVHPSIVKLSNAYPQTKLPKICLSCDVAPIVAMELNEVENYFKARNIQFKQRAAIALRSSESAMEPNKSSRPQRSPKQKTVEEKSTKKGENKTESEIGNGHCKTPKKNAIRASQKSANRVHLKRKLVEGFTTENPDDTNSAITESDSNTTIKKRKLTAAVGRSINIDADTEACTHPNSENNLKADDANVTPTSLKSSSVSSPMKKRQVGRPKHCYYTDMEIDKTVSHPSEESNTATNNEQKTAEISMNGNESLLSVAKQSPNDNSDDLLTCVGKSMPLFVCHICNSVHYTNHDLKRHQIKHTKCQFCKLRCRSLEQKKLHIDNDCVIKKMMIDLPHVALAKIEGNETVRKKYPHAFVHLPAMSVVKKSDPNDVCFKEVLFKDFPPERLDVVEILSDDDSLKELSIVPDITSNVFAKLKAKASNRVDLKNILTVFQEEVETQTNLPTNEDINTRKGTAVLKNLFPYLIMYDIPVNLQLGSFNVSFEYNPNLRSDKTLCCWNDLTPVDIKLRTGD